jgi:ketosteroid isomerase-like protein
MDLNNRKMNSRIAAMILLLLMPLVNSCKNETSGKVASEQPAMDLVEVRQQLQELDDEFSENFNNADSVALADHYAIDGTWGSIKGKDNLISAWGKSIRYANENGTPNVKFKISSISNHGEFIVEIGIFEFYDVNNTVNNTGKYLVVRKLEDGKWKMYRDIGL